MSRLHPEGAPGWVEQQMRSVLGDEGYERRESRERIRESRQEMVDRQFVLREWLINALLVLLAWVVLVLVPPVALWLWGLVL